MKRLALCIFILLSLVGCAPATFEGLKQDYSGTDKFTVEKNYQEVYRIAQGKVRECYQAGGLFGGGIFVQSDLYTDIKKGNIVVYSPQALGTQTYAGIDITAIDDTKTQVDVYYALATWSSFTKKVRKWLEEGYQGCR